MDEQKRIYLVTKGEYSDYEVILACPDPKTATLLCEKLARLMGGRLYSYNVEQIPIVHSPDEVALRTVYYVAVDRNGDEVRRWKDTKGFTVADEAPTDTSHSRFAAIGSSTRGYDVALKVARDRLAVQKAATDLQS